MLQWLSINDWIFCSLSGLNIQELCIYKNGKQLDKDNGRSHHALPSKKFINCSQHSALYRRLYYHYLGSVWYTLF